MKRILCAAGLLLLTVPVLAGERVNVALGPEPEVNHPPGFVNPSGPITHVVDLIDEPVTVPPGFWTEPVYVAGYTTFAVYGYISSGFQATCEVWFALDEGGPWYSYVDRSMGAPVGHAIHATLKLGSPPTSGFVTTQSPVPVRPVFSKYLRLSCYPGSAQEVIADLKLMLRLE